MEKLDNKQKELVKYWIEKFCEAPCSMTKTPFIEKYLTPEPVIEAGKVYILGDCFMIFANSFNRCKAIIIGYGFDFSGNWKNEMSYKISSSDSIKEATPEEYEPRLIEFAKSKGYKNGNYKCACSPHLQTENVSEYIYYDSDMRSIIHGTKTKGNFLIHNGKWAEIIDDKSEIRESVARLEAELQELKSKL